MKEFESSGGVRDLVELCDWKCYINSDWSECEWTPHGNLLILLALITLKYELIFKNLKLVECVLNNNLKEPPAPWAASTPIRLHPELPASWAACTLTFLYPELTAPWAACIVTFLYPELPAPWPSCILTYLHPDLPAPWAACILSVS